MARTKGALNKRTRATLRDLANGKLDGDGTLEYLVRIANDPHRDEKIRMEAASIALPYLRPKLSAVEQTVVNPDAGQSEEDIIKKIQELVRANPELRGPLTAAIHDPGTGMIPVDNTPEKAVDAQQQSTCSIDHNGQ